MYNWNTKDWGKTKLCLKWFEYKKKWRTKDSILWKPFLFWLMIIIKPIISGVGCDGCKWGHQVTVPSFTTFFVAIIKQMLWSLSEHWLLNEPRTWNLSHVPFSGTVIITMNNCKERTTILVNAIDFPIAENLADNRNH